MQDVRARACDALRANRRQKSTSEPAAGNGHPGSNLDKRPQHERASAHARMGDFEAWVTQPRAAVEQDIEIQRARRIPLTLPHAPMPALDRTKTRQQSQRWQRGFERGDCVDELRLRPRGVERSADIVGRHADQACARQPCKRAHCAGELSPRVRKIAAQADVDPHRAHSISMPAGGGGPPEVSSRRFLPRPRDRRFFFGPSSGFSIALRSS